MRPGCGRTSPGSTPRCAARSLSRWWARRIIAELHERTLGRAAIDTMIGRLYREGSCVASDASAWEVALLERNAVVDPLRHVSLDEFLNGRWRVPVVERGTSTGPRWGELPQNDAEALQELARQRALGQRATIVSNTCRTPGAAPDSPTFNFLTIATPHHQSITCRSKRQCSGSVRSPSAVVRAFGRQGKQPQDRPAVPHNSN